jgi:hypothetical protein
LGPSITALRDWHGGRYLEETDPRLLTLAWEERMTIVTYDLNTFPFAVRDRLESGLDHAGMVYVPARYPQNDVGRIARALAKLWRSEKYADWTNRICFLE